jgi:hypothetical protein
VNTEVLYLVAGIVAAGAIFVAWNHWLQRGIGRRLAALGFVPCDDEAPALMAAWRDLASAAGCARRIQVARCLRRGSGRGSVRHFAVADVTRAEHGQGDPDRSSLGSRYDAYLVELPQAERAARGPVWVYLSSSGSSLLRGLLQRVIAIDPPGAALEVGSAPWASCILGAYGAAPGKLDDALPPDLQQRIARAAEHGFFLVLIAEGKAGFGVLPGQRNVDAQWRYVSEWL